MNKRNALQLYYDRIFFLRTEMGRLITLSVLFSCVMVIVRAAYTGRLTFIFLIWNLLLAWLPYFISHWLMQAQEWIKNRIILTFVFFVWLACIPNAFYILTDLYHLGDHYNDFLVPQWFDLAMILSFAWNGLLLGILSVRHIEKLVHKNFNLRNELLFLYPVMWLNALGVYVGRYLRFNTWDVLTNPFLLLRDIANVLLHPLADRYASGMIFCFSILLTLIYLMLKKMSKAIR
ncbi:MAG TPA: DUF1361 domain-containing protein [Puia sp.]|jgi:uncharacterized membrane protein|nr:DUF1361 domain-containing protein [Puia sp.]